MQSNSPANILVIDDDPINNFIIKTLIDRMDMDADLTFYQNGVGAIDSLTRIVDDNVNMNNSPEYIFVDLLMPVMDGWEFLDRYDRLGLDKKINARVFVLTSSVFSEDKIRVSKYNFVEAFISKPVTTAHFNNLFSVSDNLA